MISEELIIFVFAMTFETHFDEKDLLEAVEVLKKGGIILYPTDTIWGIGCDAMNEDAIHKIYALKRRSISKSFILLVSTYSDLKQYCSWEGDESILKNYAHDRPTTFIMPEIKNLPHSLAGPDGTVAIRVVNDPFCEKLITHIRNPLVSTSANFSGDVTPASFSDVNPELCQQMDYIVKHRRDEKINSNPSRLIKIKDDGLFETLRP